MRVNSSWTLQDILKATNGQLKGRVWKRFKVITDDTRVLQPGDLFIALKGERYDGHEFVSQALEKGAKGLIIDTDHVHLTSLASDVCWIIVPDTLRALGALAGFLRNKHDVSLIAITGSCGKTTTKEAIASVMAQKFNCLKTLANVNNQVGVPFTLLQLCPAHQVACVELGTNQRGEIAYLGSITRPEISVITAIKPAHLQGLSNLQQIQKEKGDILQYTSQLFVYNADEPLVQELALNFKKRRIGFGFKPTDFTIQEVVRTPQGLSFKAKTPWGDFLLTTSLIAKHQLYALMAAAVVGWYLGLDEDTIIKGLQAFRPISGRMNYFKTKRNKLVLDDTYNANPASMEMALKTLAEQPGNKIAVLGDMLELGQETDFWHRQMGLEAANLGIDFLVLYGNQSLNYQQGALKGGMSQEHIVMANDKQDILPILKEISHDGDTILLKASHSLEFDEIANKLKELL